MKTYLRIALLGFFLSHLGLAWAQSAASEGADALPGRISEKLAKQLACVQRAAPPELAPLDGAEAKLLRARLILKPGDTEPTVDLLWNGLDAASTEKMQAYLRSYRMPCLGADEAPRTVVQEFWLRPQQRVPDAGALWETMAPAPVSDTKCLPNWLEGFKPSPDAYQIDRRWPGRPLWPVKVNAYVRFHADGSEPEVEIAYQTGSTRYVKALREHLLGLRACKDGTTPKGWLSFYMAISEGTAPPASFQPRGLVDFLRLMRGIAAQRAHFDTRTMSCPFKVRWGLYPPAQSNAVVSVGDYDANRAAFLGWLGSLKMELSHEQEEALYFEKMEVQVPCMEIDLAPEGAKP